MTKQELIKELEELRDIKNYSQSELMNTGYKTAMLDALDLVNKYFDLALVVGQSEQLCGCDAPLIRTSDKSGEYCAICEKDL